MSFEAERQQMDSLNSASRNNLQAAREFQEKSQTLNLQWVDRIINLSITIIGASVTIFIALQDKLNLESFCKENFFVMWSLFGLATIFGLISYLWYSELIQVQSGLYKFISGKKEQEAMLVYPQRLMINPETWEPLTDEDVLTIRGNIEKFDINVKKIEKMEGKWILIIKSGYISLALFLLGIAYFVYIGYDLVY